MLLVFEDESMSSLKDDMRIVLLNCLDNLLCKTISSSYPVNWHVSPTSHAHVCNYSYTQSCYLK